MDLEPQRSVEKPVGPIVMVTQDKMDVYVGRTKQMELMDHIEIALGNDMPVLKPKVEEVPDNEQGSSRLPDHVEKVEKLPPLLAFGLTVVQGEVDVGYEISRGAHRRLN